MAQTLALAITPARLPAPLEMLRICVVCGCGLALALARTSF